MSTAAQQIHSEIEKNGAIPFARFMELALYCPLCGYYEKKEDTPGQRGDFYTSVSVGPLFGQMLAFQFAEWHRERGGHEPLRIMEAGAHDGRLAADILGWLRRQRPEVFAQLEYVILESSMRRTEWQREMLAAFSGRVQWAESFADLESQTKPSNPFTIFFSNELLDAFPVHRLGWDAKAKHWFEWGVTVTDEKFSWTRLPGLPADAARQLPASPELLAVLPDGFTTEICPAAEAWWRDAANCLKQGKLLTFDYGLTAEEFFLPQRANGTLRAYHHHQIADNLLANAGDQDLTAHVNFTAIQQAGEKAGLKTEAFVSQAQFLTRIAEKIWRENSGFGEWTKKHTKQFQTLTHPNHLGRAFRALVQSRGD